MSGLGAATRSSIAPRRRVVAASGLVEEKLSSRAGSSLHVWSGMSPSDRCGEGGRKLNSDDSDFSFSRFRSAGADNAPAYPAPARPGLSDDPSAGAALVAVISIWSVSRIVISNAI